jgi:peptidyl-prolyl cis-trans isomerase SurA
MNRLLLILIAMACLPAFTAAQAASAGRAAAAAPAVTAAPVDPGHLVEEIITRVNSQIITLSEFQRSKDQLRDDVKQQDAANADKLYADREKDVLRDLVDQQLLLEKGKDLSITGDTDLIKRLDQMRKDMKLESMEALEKAATSQGISYEDFKQNMRNQIITQKVIGEEVGSHLTMSKEEEQKFYDEHKNEMEQPESIKLSEILIAPKKPAADKSVVDKPAPANPADSSAAAGDAPKSQDATNNAAAKQAEEAAALAAAEAKANDLLKQVRDGASFEDVAKKNSDGPSAAQGGDVGVFKRGALAKELEDKTFAMKSGEITDVIRTKEGYVILKVVSHQTAGVPPLKDVESRIQDALYYQNLQPALRSYLTKLREEAYIFVMPGYIDSGASPNQTAPIETAAPRESDTKKLKKKKKKFLGVPV